MSKIEFPGGKMKAKNIPLLLVVLSLMLSTLACGLFSGQAASKTDEAVVPSVEPTLEVQPVGENPLNETLPADPNSLLPDLSTLMSVPDTNGDGKIDTCEAVPAAVWEMVMGRPMKGDPSPFKDPSLGEGCAFDFGKDSTAAYFSYVTFATEKQFNDALASAVRPEPVTTVGDSAFLNSGPDARQLWVRSGDKAAMVAIGDQENVGGMVLVAPYLLQALH
jgi:hypothetical protein